MKTEKTLRHCWSVDDTVVAFYLYKFKGEEDIPYSFEEIASLISKKGDSFVGSLKMARDNFKAIDIGQGLSHPSKLQKDIFEMLKGTPKNEFRQRVIKILSDKDKGD